MSPILLPGLGAVIEAAGRVADSLITTDQERLQAQIEMRKCRRRCKTDPLRRSKSDPPGRS